jgi:hypothetical protein
LVLIPSAGRCPVSAFEFRKNELRWPVLSPPGRILKRHLNLRRSREDSFLRAGVFRTYFLLEPDMPNGAPISFPASKISSQKSDGHPLISIAIFSGVGLLASLIEILCGVQAVWF